jgi:mevalonate kinase
MQQEFYAHGKLMLTGEYFVLDGAKTLAVPTKFGQRMTVRKLNGNNSTLFWVALNSKNEPWIQLSFDTKHFEPNVDSEHAATLTKLLQICRKLNEDFLISDADFAVQTLLEFPNNWGLGSSSTLVYCLAQFAQVNPFDLLQATIGGSGYDVACAGSDLPLLYRLESAKPQFEQVHFQPAFSENLFFVHLGKKQLSSSGIAHYRSREIDKQLYINHLNALTDKLLLCNSLEKCKELMSEHENCIAEALEIEPIKKTLFDDVDVAAKSLGAWGGDFVMIAFDGTKPELAKLLEPKGLNTILSWSEMMFAN